MQKAILLSTLALLNIALFVNLTGCRAKETITLNISVGVGLTDALKEINSQYIKDKPNVTIIANFASAGILQQQIENGAPADIFISPGVAQMDTLQQEGLILEGSRGNLLTNKVVLIVPSDSTLGITSFTDLTSDKVKKVAMGDPEIVPAGTYGQQALELLGVYEQVQPRLILCSDVRQVLAYVESGNVDAGIVYSTDAAISSTVTVVATAPDEVNARVVFVVAVIKASANPGAARDYEDFLFSPEARTIFEKYGFSMVSK